MYICTFNIPTILISDLHTIKYIEKEITTSPNPKNPNKKEKRKKTC